MFFKVVWSISILLLIGCTKEGTCRFSKGNEKVKEISLNPFSTLEINGRMEVEIVPSDVYKIVFFTGENIIEDMRFEQHADTLRLYDVIRCAWLRDRSKPEMKCKVYVDSLVEIMALGYGKVFATSTLPFEQLKIQAWDSSNDFEFDFSGTALAIINHTGPSNFSISGLANSVEVYSGGNGIVDCSGLVSQQAFVNHQGTGEFLLNVQNQAFVELGWTGNVQVFGNPDELEVNDYGVGEVILN